MDHPGRVRVLVVEDSVRMAAVTRRGLEERASPVDVAANGHRRVVMAVEYNYDVGSARVHAARSGRFEVCRRVRAAGRLVRRC